MGRKFLLITLVLGVSAAASATIVVPPPPPLPVGWEETSDPRFDPCVEWVLAGAHRRGQAGYVTEQLRERAQQLGPGATSILIGFFENPRWADYHATIAGLLSAYESAEVRAWANDFTGRLLAKPGWAKEDRQRLRYLGNALRKSMNRENIEKAEARLIQLASEPRSGEKREDGLDELVSLLEEACPGELADLLERHAMEGPEHLRETCLLKLAYLRSGSAYAAALKLLDETQDEEVRARLANFICTTMAPARGWEPMDNVLRKEGE